MLTFPIIIIEIIVFSAALVDFQNFRIISGRDFSLERKIATGQAALVIAVTLLLQLTTTAQVSQQDSARKENAGRLNIAIQNFTASHNSISNFTCSATTDCSEITDIDTGKMPMQGDNATATSGIVYTIGIQCDGTPLGAGYAVHYWVAAQGKSACIGG